MLSCSLKLLSILIEVFFSFMIFFMSSCSTLFFFSLKILSWVVFEWGVASDGSVKVDFLGEYFLQDRFDSWDWLILLEIELTLDLLLDLERLVFSGTFSFSA